MGDLIAAAPVLGDDLDQFLGEQLQDPHFAYLFGRQQAFAEAERAVSDAATGATLEGWRWWRPSWSSGRHEGLLNACDIIRRRREMASPHSASTAQNESP